MTSTTAIQSNSIQFNLPQQNGLAGLKISGAFDNNFYDNPHVSNACKNSFRLFNRAAQNQNFNEMVRYKVITINQCQNLRSNSPKFYRAITQIMEKSIEFHWHVARRASLKRSIEALAISIGVSAAVLGTFIYVGENIIKEAIRLPDFFKRK